MSEGQLKTGWMMAPLGEVFTFRGGGTPDKKQKNFWNGNIPWASVKDIKKTFLNSTIDFITKEGLANSAASMAVPGDLILVTRISPGKTSLPKIEAAINQDLKVVSIEGGIPPLYAHYLFQSLSKKIIEKKK